MVGTASTYDELPYGFCAFPQVHPDRLAVVGRLFGLSPAPVGRCRVLEIGCALGGNLLPMAAALPESRFVGIDLAPRQIEQGRAVVERLGLGNLELRAQDVTAFDPAEGPFDYILCHGVYSWVPPAVQEAILSLCRRGLSPDGLATISYNVHPGWHVRGAVRDILRYGARGAGAPREQVARARAYLAFVARNVFDTDTPYARTVREAAETLAAEDPVYIFHEYLEEHNHPTSFAEFVGRAEGAGLRYVGEASLRDPSSLLRDEARAMLTGISDDRVRCEQTLDFLWRQTFRRDVLCPAGREPGRWPEPAGLKDMLLVALAEPVADEPSKFRNAAGHTLTTRDPALRAALGALHRARPRGVRLAALLAAAGQAVRNVDEAALARSLLACATAGLVELHTHLPPIAARPSDRPQAGPVARWQAAEGHVVVNLRHQCYELDGLSRAVLALLDGARSRPAVCEALAGQLGAGTLALPAGPDGRKPTAADLPQIVDEVLDALAGLSMLVER